MPARKQHDPTRFHQSYFKRPDGCWIWTKARFTNGYGAFKVAGKMWRAHRWAYSYFYADPGERLVCHTCDNPGCVNPDHLFLGTAQDNQIDYRHKSGTYIDPLVAAELIARGYNQHEIARRLGCSQSGVSMALARASARNSNQGN